MNQIKGMVALFVFLLLVSLVYAQDFSLFSGKFYELQEDEKSIEFEFYNGTYNLCENDKKTIPIMVANKANADDRYSLGVAGASWASLNVREFSLPRRQSGVVFLNVNPDDNAQGKYSIKVNAVSSDNAQKSLDIEVNVGKCYSLDLELEKAYDKVCGGEVKKYSGEVANDGLQEIDVELSVNGPNWISIEENEFFIDAGEIEKFELNADVPANAQGIFDVFVNAKIKIPSIKSEKKLSIEVVPKYGCYKADFLAASKITNYYSNEYIPLKITNRGIKQAAYSIRLEAPEWISIEPEEIVVNSGQFGNLNLNINPNNDIPEGTYPIKINANFGDIAYQKNIDVILKRNKFADVKSFFAFYQYYLYVLIFIIVVLFVFRRRISNKIKASYKNFKVRGARLRALKSAREAREKKAKEAKKPKLKIKKFSLKWFLIALIAVFLLLFFSVYQFDFPISKKLVVDYNAYFIVGILISIAIILLIEFYKPLFKTLTKINRKKR